MGRRQKGRMVTIARKGPVVNPGLRMRTAGAWGVALTYYRPGACWAWITDGEVEDVRVWRSPAGPVLVLSVGGHPWGVLPDGRLVVWSMKNAGRHMQDHLRKWEAAEATLAEGGLVLDVTPEMDVQVIAQDAPRRATHPDGYLKIFLGVGHPLADRSGWAYAHRLALTAKLRRRPGPHELVRFEDGDKRNLDPRNIGVKSWEAHQAAFAHGAVR